MRPNEGEKAPKYNFNDKSVLITGASKGLGYEIAKNYLNHGANLVICSSNSQNIKKSYETPT